MSKNLVSKTQFAELVGITAGAVTGHLKRGLKPALVGSRIDLDHPAVVEYLARRDEPKPREPVPGVDPAFEEALEICRANGRFTASNIQKTMKIGYARAVRIRDQLAAAGHCEPAQTAKPATQQAAKPPPMLRIAPPRRENPFVAEDELVEIPDDIEGLVDLTLRELIEKFGTATRFYDWLRALKEIEAVNEKRIKNAQSRGRLISRSLVETGVIDPFNSAHVRLLTDGAKAITAGVLAKHESGMDANTIENYVSDIVGSFIRPVKNKVARNLANRVEED